MTARSNPTTRLNCFILLMAWVSAVSAATADSKTITTNSPSSHRCLGVGLHSTRVKRYLRADRWTDDHSYEDRTFDISGVAKVKDLAKAGTKKLQKLAESAKIKVTSNNHQTTDKRFRRFKVDKAGGNLFESTQFQKWHSSVARAYKKNPEAGEVAMVSTLTAHYGDEALARMLAAAKQMNAIADNLGTVQLKNWVAGGKTADDAFNLLKLNQEGDKLLQSPVLSTWVSYMAKLDKDPYELLFFKLTTRYNDEGIAKILVVPKHDYITKIIAKKLEELQLEKWRGSGKSATDIFRILKLSEEGEATLLKSSVLSIWVSYVEKLKKNPYELLLLALKAHLDEAGLARMLAAAKNDGSNVIVGKMENIQFEKWLKDGKSGGDIFLLLRLSKEGDKVFESPVWSTWVSYLTKLEESNRDKLMLSVLRTQLSDEGLAKIVANAKNVESTKTIASKVERDLWWITGQISDDIFNLLKLNEKGSNILESPALNTWVSYVSKLSKLKKNPDKFMVISQLEKRYGGMELAKMLASTKQQTSLKNANDSVKTTAVQAMDV